MIRLKADYLIISIAAILSVGAGYWCWNKNGDTNLTGVLQSTRTDVSDNEEVAGESFGWYQVPELGIEFRVRKDVIDDLVYSYVVKSDSGVDGASFSTKKLSQVPGCEKQGIATITKMMGKPEDYEGADYLRARAPVQLGDFFVIVTAPQAICALPGYEDQFETVYTEESRRFGGWSAIEFWSSRELGTISGVLPELTWFQVPELGIEFLVSKKIADGLQAYVNRMEAGSHFGSVRFSSSIISGIPDCEASSGPLGAIARIKGKPTDYEDFEYYNARNPRQLSDSFVIWDGPQAICAGEEHLTEFNNLLGKLSVYRGWEKIALESVREL
jgi:hypothetical protein